MKHYVKCIFRNGLIGMTIGLSLNSLGYFIAAFSNEVLTLNASMVIFQFLICLFTGFYCAAISVVYEIEHWSLLRATLTHAILISLYFPIAYVAGWLPTGLLPMIGFIIYFIVIYGVIWFSFKRYFDKQAKQLNEQLKQLNSN